MLPDTHMHTPLCKHASGAPAEYREVARSLNMAELCFTDHAPNPDGVGALYGMDMSQFDDYRGMIRELQDGRQPTVFFGIEADYYPACRRHLSGWLSANSFDLVLCSVHYLGNWGFDNPDEMDGWKSADVKGVWLRYFELLGEAAESRLFDVVGHIDLPKKFGHRLRDGILKEMAQPVLDKIAAAGMTVELNTGGLRKPAAEIYPSALLLSLARERGIPICFGSDAHEPQQVGQDFDKALRLAREAGYTDYMRFRRRAKMITPLPTAEHAATPVQREPDVFRRS
ncbi:MAG: histidinol-phosphatase HisJ family protein [bacterium]